MNKSRRKRQTEHAACVGDKNAYRVRDQGVDGRIILKRILKDWGGRVWTGLICLRTGTSGVLLKCEEFLDWLRNQQLFKDFAQ